MRQFWVYALGFRGHKFFNFKKQFYFVEFNKI